MVEYIDMLWTALQVDIIPRCIEFILAPLNNPDMLYLILPLLASLTMMEIYFGRNKTEELGWNTAFGNTVSLFFVIAGLGKYLLETFSLEELVGGGLPTYKLVLVFVLGLQIGILIRFNYYHALNERVAFLIFSSLPVNVTALLAILLVMGSLPFDWVTLGAALVTFCMFWVFYTLLQMGIEPSEEAAQIISKKRKEREESWRKKTTDIRYRLILFKDRMLSQFTSREDLRRK